MRTGCRRRYGTLLDNSVAPFSDGMEQAKVASPQKTVYALAELPLWRYSRVVSHPFHSLFFILFISIFCVQSLCGVISTGTGRLHLH